jgi:hypothetical protein
MIISHKYKFIYVHVPKTAGSSIELNYSKRFAGERDVISRMQALPEIAQNQTGWFNPIPELISRSYDIKKSLSQFKHRHKYGPHQSAIVIKQRTSKKIWDSYFKFTVERTPFDKMVSAYFMNWGKRPDAHEPRSFENWVRRGKNIPDGIQLYGYKGKVILDKVIQFDNLNTELKEVYEFLGVPFNGLEEREKTHHRLVRNYREMHTPYTVEFAKEFYKKEIELFNYQF